MCLHKYIVRVIILCVMGGASQTYARTYPTPVIAKPACRFQHRDLLGDECKMELPRITNADYYMFKDNKLYRSIYTVLWGATYTYRRDIGGGGHPGVDIATAKGTPVVAIGDGVVVDARRRGDRGNTVIIAHTVGRDRFYSVYAHLDSIAISAGISVSPGTLIGRVGDTGNAFGNHLHFQIDRDTDVRHPFFFPGCRGSISDIVNLGLCREQLPVHTIDPIVFLESQGASVSSTTILSPGDLTPYQEVQQYITQDFLDRYPINITTDLVDNTMSIDDIGVLTVSIPGYDGVLPESLVISVDTGSQHLIDVSVSEVSYIDQSRSLIINPREAGVAAITLRMGDVVVERLYIAITPTRTVPQPTRAMVRQIATRRGMISVVRLYNSEGAVLRQRHGSLQISVLGDMLCTLPIVTPAHLRRALRGSCSSRGSIGQISDEYTFSGAIILQTKKNIGPEDIVIRRSDGGVISLE